MKQVYSRLNLALGITIFSTQLLFSDMTAYAIDITSDMNSLSEIFNREDVNSYSRELERQEEEFTIELIESKRDPYSSKIPKKKIERENKDRGAISISYWKNIIGTLRKLKIKVDINQNDSEYKPPILPQVSAANIFKDVYDFDISIKEVTKSENTLESTISLSNSTSNLNNTIDRNHLLGNFRDSSNKYSNLNQSTNLHSPIQNNAPVSIWPSQNNNLNKIIQNNPLNLLNLNNNSSTFNRYNSIQGYKTVEQIKNQAKQKHKKQLAQQQKIFKKIELQQKQLQSLKKQLRQQQEQQHKKQMQQYLKQKRKLYRQI